MADLLTAVGTIVVGVSLGTKVSRIVVSLPAKWTVLGTGGDAEGLIAICTPRQDRGDI